MLSVWLTALVDLENVCPWLALGGGLAAGKELSVLAAADAFKERGSSSASSFTTEGTVALPSRFIGSAMVSYLLDEGNVDPGCFNESGRYEVGAARQI